MRVGVVGINHKLADLRLREELAKACQKRFNPLCSFHAPHAFILLSTCNRTEVYFSSEDLTDTHIYLLNILRQEVAEDFDQKLYSYFGLDCFLHLSRVTAGLDSAILGETEIQGQVKTAYEAVTEYQTLPKELHFVFQKALGIAKKIRSEIQLGQGMPNLEHAIFNIGKHFFKSLEGIRILFIGASEINQKIFNYFCQKRISGITLCNRSYQHACDFALSQDLHILDWSELPRWTEYDWVILGTKAPSYLIKQMDLQGNFNPVKLLIDLSVPRNVDPKVSQDSRITLWNIDQINRLLNIRNRWLERSLTEAEEKIAHSIRQHGLRYKQKEDSKLTILAVTA